MVDNGVGEEVHSRGGGLQRRSDTTHEAHYWSGTMHSLWPEAASRLVSLMDKQTHNSFKCQLKARTGYAGDGCFRTSGGNAKARSHVSNESPMA